MIQICNIRHLIFVWLFCCLFTALLADPAYGQRRDYMTDAEIDLVRENQDIDLRIDVLVKMIDRRFSLLGISPGGDAIKKKEADKWGEPPTGSSLELFFDIRRLLEKAIDDIDVIAARNNDALKQNKTEGDLFPKAVRKLEAAARRFLPLLSVASDKAQNEKERAHILNSMQYCEQIIEAAATLPAPARKSKS